MAASYHFVDADKTAIFVDDGEGKTTTVPAGHPLFRLLSEGTPARGETPAIEPVQIIGYRKPALQVPASVTPLQARIALNAAGLREVVEAWVAKQPLEAQDAWFYGIEVRRSAPFIAVAATALGLTDKQVDELFIAAASAR